MDKDKETGRWTKEKDGKTLYYMPELASTPGIPENARWAEDLSQGGIPLLDARLMAKYPQQWMKESYGKDTVDLRIYRLDESGQLEGITGMVYPDTYVSLFASSEDYAKNIPQHLLENFIVKRYQHNDITENTQDEREAFLKSLKIYKWILNNPMVAKDNSTARAQEWYLGKGINIILVDWNTADPKNDSSFFGEYSTMVRGKYVITSDGTLNIVMAYNPDNTKIDDDKKVDLIFEWIYLAMEEQHLPPIDMVGVDEAIIDDEITEKGLPDIINGVHMYELRDKVDDAQWVTIFQEYTPTHPSYIQFLR